MPYSAPRGLCDAVMRLSSINSQRLKHTATFPPARRSCSGRAFGVCCLRGHGRGFSVQNPGRWAHTDGGCTAHFSAKRANLQRVVASAFQACDSLCTAINARMMDAAGWSFWRKWSTGQCLDLFRPRVDLPPYWCYSKQIRVKNQSDLHLVQGCKRPGFANAIQVC